MHIEQKKSFLINAMYWLFIISIGYLLIEYLLPITIPFILGFIIAHAVVKTSDKIKKNNKLIRLLVATLFFCTVGLLITLLAIKGFSSLSLLVQWIPTLYEKQIGPAIEAFLDGIIKVVNQLDPSLKASIEVLWESVISATKDLFATASGVVVNFISTVVKSVPSILISTLAMIISTFFFAMDYERMFEFINKNLPHEWKNKIISLKSYMTNTLFVVIRSYLTIMLMTFTELSILFFVFGIENGFILAAIIALFDIMPVLGTGGILIPWAIISLLLGTPVLAIELILIYVIITVVRNYVEPKIVGAQLGLHPIITLVSMFIGLRLFGFLGMFGLPVGISYFWQKHKEDSKK